MQAQHLKRKLVAVIAADVAGYTRLMGADEDATMAAWWSHRKELIDPTIAGYEGRIVKHTGDGFLAEFPSVLDAVRCAVAMQSEMARRNADVPEDRRMRFRMGVNLCDIMSDDEDIYGDGVNIAARLESLAEPGGVSISGAVHDQVRGKLDFSWEDLGERRVKNVAEPVRAYRMTPQTAAAPAHSAPGRRKVWAVAGIAAALAVVAVAAWYLYPRPSPPPAADIHATEMAALAPPDQPSIAVLPFDNISGDPEQDYFVDGITEDLITDLSQVSGLFVIARNSVFTYKGKPVKVQQVGRELGVQYVLEGSVRKSGNRIRINAQLVDAVTGRHLWAARYDRELTEVFALQDEVTAKIVSALAIKLTVDERERLSRAAVTSPEAYDTLLRGLELFRRFTRETNAEARVLFEKAIALDPQYARAYADVALTHGMDVTFGWTDAPEAANARGLEFARNGLALDDTLPQVHFALASTYLRHRRYDESIAADRKSIGLDPNYADGYASLAMSLAYAGRPEDGLKAIRKAMRLNPRHPFFYVWIVGHAYFLMGRYAEAATAFERVLERNPQFPGGHMTLAATYGHLGRTADAEWEVEETLTLLPDFSLARERRRALYKNPADLERYIEGLRKAGLK
ncbi:MAG: tetratricopeptide repeat protein [Proteobacteria bacterium]|nr:tetratricopeptide repeat protein [Pseudomonadota bacterium]